VGLPANRRRIQVRVVMEISWLSGMEVPSAGGDPFPRSRSASGIYCAAGTVVRQRQSEGEAALLSGLALISFFLP